MTESEKTEPVNLDGKEAGELTYYRIQFRRDGQHFTASSSQPALVADSSVMVKTDHGLEPARVVGFSPICGCDCRGGKANYEIHRQVRDGEQEKYANLTKGEERAEQVCNTLIEKHELKMHLVRVERYFNGSKMIFYFTADSRVDFRALVKDLVQEFRTRVEMRQVGVRHETKMLGGIGTCGRELCCSSFINKFNSVSIKMAKEQDLPLNPTKISGVCNRLLCCLTYEHDSYKKKRKSMPKPGRRIRIGKDQYLVRRQMVLQDSILAENKSGEQVVLQKDEWRSFKPIKREHQEKKKIKKNSNQASDQAGKD